MTLPSSDIHSRRRHRLFRVPTPNPRYLSHHHTKPKPPRHAQAIFPNRSRRPSINPSKHASCNNPSPSVPHKPTTPIYLPNQVDRMAPSTTHARQSSPLSETVQSPLKRSLRSRGSNAGMSSSSVDGKDDVGEGSSRDGVRGSLVGAGGGGGGGGDVTDARGGKFPCCPKPCFLGACCL